MGARSCVIPPLFLLFFVLRSRSRSPALLCEVQPALGAPPEGLRGAEGDPGPTAPGLARFAQEPGLRKAARVPRPGWVLASPAGAVRRWRGPTAGLFSFWICQAPRGCVTTRPVAVLCRDITALPHSSWAEWRAPQQRAERLNCLRRETLILSLDKSHPSLIKQRATGPQGAAVGAAALGTCRDHNL